MLDVAVYVDFFSRRGSAAQHHAAGHTQSTQNTRWCQIVTDATSDEVTCRDFGSKLQHHCCSLSCKLCAL